MAENKPLQPALDNASEGTAMTNSTYIVVNGQERPWPSAQSLVSFLTEHQLPPVVAVAINDRIVPRSKHAETVVQPGDRIEIVHPVGGG